MSQHTPGPWFATPFYMPYDWEGAYGDRPVNWHVTDGKEWDEYGDHALDLQVDTSEADARLIAAAPDLLEALGETLEELCGWLEDRMAGTGRTPEDTIVVAKARAAIAKARCNPMEIDGINHA